MSKVKFSKKISETMYHKMCALESYDYNEFFKRDEYFEFVLCLTYLTLSKEKIIDKDMKNKKRLERLTKHVSKEDIDAVFRKDFSINMPNIKNAKENNNLWILDNIRDSIMHEAFEIDEERKLLIIKNTQYDRDLEVEIPFSWIIDYAKYDILSKKVSSSYHFKQFYYNKDKKAKKFFHTKKEIFDNILYKVHITGTNFNIKQVETRIKEIFKECSNLEIADTISEQIKLEIGKDDKYLISFCYAKKIVKEKIKKEFPGINLEIYVVKRKNKILNISSKLASYYKNYDLLYKELNNLVSPKGISLLNYLSNIIENLDNRIESLDNLTEYNKTQIINYILNGEEIEYEYFSDQYVANMNILNVLRTICLNTYGISSLVINHSDLYKKYYQNGDISDYSITAYTKQKFIDYANKCKKLRVDILDIEIKLFEKQEQLKYCTNEKGKSALEKSISELSLLRNKLEEKLCLLGNFTPYIYYKKQDLDKKYEMACNISRYYEHFSKAKTKEGKVKIRKVISKLLDVQIEEESKYIYGRVDNFDEVLTIIRNSLSHIGRITIKDNGISLPQVVLNDYDNEHNHSGCVIIPYKYFLYMLKEPYEEKNDKILIKK